jgi:fibronectin-binding autotransporter adhesin
MSKSITRTSVALTILLAMQAAQAQTFNGTTSGTAPGSTWSSGAGWSAAPVSGATTALVFGDGAGLASGATVHTSQNISPPFQLNSLTMSYAGLGNPASVTINTNQLNFVSNGSTTPSIVLNATGTSRPQIVFVAPVLFSNNINIGGTSDALFKGDITNANEAVVTKSGTGTVRIESTNAGYTGNFNVNAGKLQIGNNGGGGDIGTGTITLAGGNLTVRKSGNLTLNNTITGTGSFTMENNSDAILTINKANSYTGATTLATSAADVKGTMRLGISNGLGTTSVLTINNSGTSVQTFNLAGFNQTLGGLAAAGTTTTSKVALGTGTLTINDAGNRTFAGEISGAGNVVKQGAGTWSLSGINTLTGTTTISAGGLTLATGGSINNSSRVNVGNNATFTNNSATAVSAALSLTEGANLAGTGTFTGSLFVTADLGDGFSTITLGNYTASGVLTFNLSNLTAGTYELFDTATPTGAFTSVAGTGFVVADSFTGTVGGFDYSYNSTSNTLVLTTSAIPEPSTTAALAGLAVLGAILIRRRPSV